jgi:hypothetical protein
VAERMVFGLQEELATSATLAVELVGRSVANPSRQQVSTYILKSPLYSVFCSKYTRVLKPSLNVVKYKGTDL